jgi:hypothetical protein
MKTLDIALPHETVTIRPVPRCNLAQLSKLLVELQAIWIEEEFSTGDTLAREDAWTKVQQIWGMLPTAASASATLGSAALDTLADDYEQLGLLFLGDPSKAWQGIEGGEGSLATFNLDAFHGCKLWALHEVSPRKKLLAADQLRREKRPTEPSPQTTSRSKRAATKQPTPLPTSSTDLEKSA